MSYPTTRFTCRGQPILQFTSTGTLSEYIVINQIYVAKIHDDAPLDRVCLLGCGIPTGYGAAINTAGGAPYRASAVSKCCEEPASRARNTVSIAVVEVREEEWCVCVWC